jgi:hypothetical protein
VCGPRKEGGRAAAGPDSTLSPAGTRHRVRDDTGVAPVSVSSAEGRRRAGGGGLGRLGQKHATRRSGPRLALVAAVLLLG